MEFGLGGDTASVFNLGNLIVPFIVCVTCIIGFFIAAKMPRDYTPALLAREFKKMDPSLDISALESQEPVEEKSEILFVQIGLSILSGFIFGFIWVAFLLKSVRKLSGKGMPALRWLIACLIPFASIPVLLKLNKELQEAGKANNITVGVKSWVLVVLAVIFPILPINLVALSLLQHNANKLHLSEEV
jgi:hypothetical protein